MIWRIIPLIVIFCLTVPVYSQDKIANDLERLSEVFAPEAKNPEVKRTVDSKNEFSLILSIAYNFYKAFLSSQDANNCAFHPTCSTYAVETLKTNGILGIFDAIDRLTRCNGFSPEKYSTHSESKLFHDPVKKIH